MEINASVDVGKNLAGLIEKLAQQIGTTADKVFPWYVKQQVIEGYMFCFMLISAFLVFGIGFLYSFKRADFEGDGNRYSVLSVIFGICLVLTTIIAAIDLAEGISQILNPEMHALKSMVSDMSKLLH